MTAGKALGVNDHREMARGRQRVQDPGWCEGRGEKYHEGKWYLSTSGTEKGLASH